MRRKLKVYMPFYSGGHIVEGRSKTLKGFIKVLKPKYIKRQKGLED